MKRIQLNGHLHAAPFDRLFRPLTEAERDGMRRSIEAGGVLSPVHVYMSPVHGRAIVDGIHRAELADELGVDEVPVLSLGRLTDEEAEAKAYELNAKRRHLTAEELAAMATERRGRVVAARTEGKSIRTIAREEGVHPSTVAADLAATVKAEPVYVPTGDYLNNPAPAVVTGADGKTYPATRPVAVAVEEPTDIDAPDSPPVSDDTGEHVPLPAAPVLIPTHRPEPSDGEALEKARKAGQRFVDDILAVLGRPIGEKVVAASRRHGFPISRADGGPWRWPLLETLVGVLADVAAGEAA